MTDDQQGRQRAESLKSLKEKLEDRKSRVRVWLTYWAAGFLFLIGLLLIGWFMYNDNDEKALTVFSTILPTTTFIIGYWFAKRSGESSSSNAKDVSESTQTETQQDKANENQDGD